MGEGTSMSAPAGESVDPRRRLPCIGDAIGMAEWLRSKQSALRHAPSSEGVADGGVV